MSTRGAMLFGNFPPSMRANSKMRLKPSKKRERERNYVLHNFGSLRQMPALSWSWLGMFCSRRHLTWASGVWESRFQKGRRIRCPMPIYSRGVYLPAINLCFSNVVKQPWSASKIDAGGSDLLVHWGTDWRIRQQCYLDVLRSRRLSIIDLSDLIYEKDGGCFH